MLTGTNHVREVKKVLSVYSKCSYMTIPMVAYCIMVPFVFLSILCWTHKFRLEAHRSFKFGEVFPHTSNWHHVFRWKGHRAGSHGSLNFWIGDPLLLLQWPQHLFHSQDSLGKPVPEMSYHSGFRCRKRWWSCHCISVEIISCRIYRQYWVACIGICWHC